MSEASLRDNDKVTNVKDNGQGRQWGLGRLFVQLDGAKTRVNVKAVFTVLVILFGFIGVFTTIKPRPQIYSNKSPIGMDQRLSESIAQSPDVRINSYDFSVNQNQRVTHGSAGTPRKVLSSGLVITRRNGDAKIPPGALARAKLTSGASNGFTKAELLEPLSPYGELLLPSGTTLVGAAQSSTERLSIHFTKAVLPDGQVLDIDAMACDGDDKMPGIRGVNIKGQALSLAGAVGLNFAGGMAMGLQSARSQDETQTPSVKDGLLSGASVAALEKGREISQDLKSEPPVIEIKEQTEFYILFLGAR